MRKPWSAPHSAEQFRREVETLAQALATAPDYAQKLAAKQAQRARDEAEKPLAAYRAEELMHMTLNFYGFDPQLPCGALPFRA